MITTRKTFAIVALCLLSPCLWGGENPSPEWPGDDREKKDTVSVADTTVRRGFFRKVIDYFDDSNKNKKHKKFDFTIIGGPNYSEDTKFGIGLVAAGLYRVDPSDTLSQPSDVSLYGNVSTSGFYMVGIRGNTFFSHDKYRLLYNLSFYSFPGKFWGIGYETNTLDANKSDYTRQQYRIKTDFLIRAARNFYIGPGVGFDYVEGKDFERIDLLQGQERLTRSISAGFSLVYDSRDASTAASRGIYAQAEQRFFPAFMGNEYAFSRTDLIFDYYKTVWKGGVLAIDYHSQFNYGNVPWTMLAPLGTSYRMRGYYEGRYRDENIVEAQVELRQKVWRRNGIVVWAGAGNIFRDFGSFDIGQTLPNFGVGYRWEFKKKMNIRLDLGFGRNGSGIIFNINEAF